MTDSRDFFEILAVTFWTTCISCTKSCFFEKQIVRWCNAWQLNSEVFLVVQILYTPLAIKFYTGKHDCRMYYTRSFQIQDTRSDFLFTFNDRFMSAVLCCYIFRLGYCFTTKCKYCKDFRDYFIQLFSIKIVKIQIFVVKWLSFVSSFRRFLSRNQLIKNSKKTRLNNDAKTALSLIFFFAKAIVDFYLKKN